MLNSVKLVVQVTSKEHRTKLKQHSKEHLVVRVKLSWKQSVSVILVLSLVTFKPKAYKMRTSKLNKRSSSGQILVCKDSKPPCKALGWVSKAPRLGCKACKDGCKPHKQASKEPRQACKARV